MTTHKRGRKKKPISKYQLEAVRDELIAAYDNAGTWHAVAAHYGISKAAAHRIANDKAYHPSQGTIDKVLIKDRPSPIMFEMPPCPDCHGAPHAGRCNGKPVAKVVALAPGEAVRKMPLPRRVTRLTDMSTRDLARAIRERIEYP